MNADEGGTGLNPRESFRLKRNAQLRRAGRRARGEYGGSLVETAICITLLLGLILGVIEGCWAIFSFHYIADAAREATRYAVVRGSDWTTSTGAVNSCDSVAGSGTGYAAPACAASVQDVQNFAANLGLGPVGLTAADVCVEYLSSTSMPTPPITCTASTGTPTSNPALNDAQGDIVVIQITYPFTFGLPGYTVSALTYNLKTTSEAVIAY